MRTVTSNDKGASDSASAPLAYDGEGGASPAQRGVNPVKRCSYPLEPGSPMIGELEDFDSIAHLTLHRLAASWLTV